MFVGDEVQLEIGFAVARDRLRQLAEAGVLLGSSEDAYDHGTSGLQRVGVPGLSKLVRVQVRELAWTYRSGWPSGGKPPGRAAGCSRSWTPTSRWFPSGSETPS